MSDAVDFSAGERGWFDRPGAGPQIPVYLDGDVLDWLIEKARQRDVTPSQLAGDMRRNGVERDEHKTYGA